MNIAQQHASPALPLQLKVQVQQLAHALEGFPVLDLVETYAADAARSASSEGPGISFLLAHACLTNWQSALDIAIESFPANGDEAHQLYGLSSMDFVLAFVPIEPAFMLAVTSDGDLFMDAWQRNILLVSPSTLLFVVRTVAHLWRQEAQSRNTQDIAKRGAELYDKLCGFVADLQKVGERLEQAKSAFTDAQNKLSLGKGNAIRQAEMLRDLGVKPSKSLPQPLVQRASLDEDIVVIPEVLTMDAMLDSRTDAGDAIAGLGRIGSASD